MKRIRHEKIIELVKNNIVETQEELASLLNENGFVVTQATASRDIRELNLTKITCDKGHQKYVVLKTADSKLEEKYIRILRDGFVSMDVAENILIVKTVSGMAMAVATALDSMNWEEVVGCIAGDDTIMCAIRRTDDMELVCNKILQILK